MSVNLLTVYREKKQQLYTLARNVTGCRQLAEDALQSAFQKLLSLKVEPVDLTAYVLKTVKNTAIDLTRTRRKDSTDLIGADQIPQSTDELFNAQDDDSDTTIQIRKAMSKLDVEDRELILLKVFAGMTFRQIAEMYQRSPNSVATRYRRLMQRLQNLLRVLDEQEN